MNTIEEKLDQTQMESARIELHDFQLKRLDGQKTVLQLAADKAQFFEPNRVLLTGHVVSTRLNNDTEEFGRSDEANVLLGIRSIHEVMGDVKIKTAEAKGKVALIMKDYQMRTERAVFDAATEVVSSDLPVSITGSGREINGEQGFSYTMKDQTLRVPGPVKGFFTPTSKAKP